MYRMVVGLVLVAALPSLPRAESAKLTLPEVIAKAITGPRGQMTTADREAATARSKEADAARYPRFKVTAGATISPEINCDDPLCQTTSPQNFALAFSGFFGTVQLDVTQPVYTFGKIGAAREAAAAGRVAADALANETAGDIAVDAARAYWGLKVARELGAMLDDGLEQIEGARASFMEDKSASIQDRQRITILIAEARNQRAEAGLQEAQALAGLRALVGPNADIDSTELAPVTRPIPASLGVTQRPQAIAAKAGALAADKLADFQARQYYPDLALVGSAVYARSQGVDDPPSVFANDPYNRGGVGALLGLQWNFEPWTVKARTERARAEARRAHAQSDLAAIGATYDGEMALAEARGASAKVEAAREGEQAGRTWVASALQSEALGIADSRELADAYIAWFQMRARYAMAVFQWNVAVTRLDRAAGVFKASR